MAGRTPPSLHPAIQHATADDVNIRPTRIQREHAVAVFDDHAVSLGAQLVRRIEQPLRTTPRPIHGEDLPGWIRHLNGHEASPLAGAVGRSAKRLRDPAGVGRARRVARVLVTRDGHGSGLVVSRSGRTGSRSVRLTVRVRVAETGSTGSNSSPFPVGTRAAGVRSFRSSAGGTTGTDWYRVPAVPAVPVPVPTPRGVVPGTSRGRSSGTTGSGTGTGTASSTGRVGLRDKVGPLGVDVNGAAILQRRPGRQPSIPLDPRPGDGGVG